MNTLQSEKQQKNISSVRKLITKHHTKSIKKLQGFLVEEYRVAVSERTIKRYLAKIEKQNKKQIAIKKQETPKVKQEPESLTYPYFITAPDGWTKYKITGDNMTVTVSWGEDGRLITWNKEKKLWCYDNDGTPFDHTKKPTPAPETQGNLSWDY